jgi:hypothetical protein
MNGGNARAGAWALILGAVSYIALMAAHPTHAGAGMMIGPLSLNAVVHGAALVMQPVLLFGFWQLTRAMGGKALAEMALCIYGLAAGATIIAATLSGIVIPVIMEAGQTHGASMPGPGPADAEALRQQLQSQAIYTVWLNRSFAGVHVGLFALATLLWSIAWPSRAALAAIARAAGFLIGVGVIAWALSGAMTLEAQHGALLVTLVQMIWTILAAAALMSMPARDAT